MGVHVVSKRICWCDRCGQVQVPPSKGPQSISLIAVKVTELREGRIFGPTMPVSDIEVTKHLCSSCLVDAMKYIGGWNMGAPRAFLDSLPAEEPSIKSALFAVFRAAAELFSQTERKAD